MAYHLTGSAPLRRPARAGLIAVGLAGALSACATQSRTVDAGGPGVDWSRDLRFTFDVAADPETGALEGETRAASDHVITSLVVDALQRRGMTSSTVSNSPYFLQVEYSDRPALTGAYAEGPNTAGQPDWLVKPGTKHWWTSPKSHACTLSLRLTLTPTGQEVYYARATQISPRAGCMAIAPQLVDAALKAMPPPQPEANRLRS